MKDDVYKLFCGTVTDDDGNLGTSSSEGEQLHNMHPTRGNGIMISNSGVEVANLLIVNNCGSFGAGLFVLYHAVNGNNVANCRKECNSQSLVCFTIHICFNLGLNAGN